MQENKKVNLEVLRKAKEYKNYLQNIIMGSKRIEDELAFERIATMSDKEFNRMLGIITEYHRCMNVVLNYTTILEELVNEIVELNLFRIGASNSKEWTESQWVPISTNLRLLRFADLIDEDTYKDLRILFSIRNIFAHKTLRSELKDVFAPLAKLKFTRKDLPEEMKNNDYGKFMIASEYYEDILKTIYEKIEEDLSELREQGKL